MKTMLFSLITTFIVGSFCTLGVDVAEIVTAQKWTCLKNSGYQFAIVRAFEPSGKIDMNAISNLKNAKNSGLTTDIYMISCRGKNATTQVNELIDGIPGDLYTTIWVNVELNYSPGCYWSQMYDDYCDLLTETINRIKVLGKQVGVYTSGSQWNLTIHNPYVCYSPASQPLWYARYDNTQSFANFQKIGGWTKPFMKQFYGGDVSVCGVNLDRNWRP